LDGSREFSLHLRIPAWSGSQFVPGGLYRYVDNVRPNWEVSVNGKPLRPKVKNGFISIHRKWKAGDVVRLYLPMPLRYTHADDNVEDDRDRICLTRGPLVYCAEAADNDFNVLQAFIETIPENYSLETAKEGLLKGIDFITIPVKALNDEGLSSNATMKLLPYYAWNNRSDDAMIVWIPAIQREKSEKIKD
jgi:DUF1680 family protein